MIKIPGKPTGMHLVKGKYGNYYISKATKKYQNKVAFWSLKEINKIKRGEKCKVVINVYFKKKQSTDIDSIAEVILNGMQTIVYRNDRCVKELHIKAFENQSQERIEVETYRI